MANFLFKHNTIKRQLTDNEIRLAQSVLGDAVDCSQVYITTGVWWLLHPHAAMTCGNTVVFPVAHYQEDFARTSLDVRAWFIHELVHVWQYQQGFPIILAGIYLAMTCGYYHARAYHYPDLAKVRGFGFLNMEQQASVVAHYYLAQNGDCRFQLLLPQFRRLLAPLLQQPDNCFLLPRY